MMNEETDWDKINAEKREQIQYGQAWNGVLDWYAKQGVKPWNKQYANTVIEEVGILFNMIQEGHGKTFRKQYTAPIAPPASNPQVLQQVQQQTQSIGQMAKQPQPQVEEIII